MSLPICKECPHLPVAETGLIQAHVRADVGRIEVEALAQLFDPPFMIATDLVAVHIREMLAVDSVHLCDMLDRQCRRLNLHL